MSPPDIWIRQYRAEDEAFVFSSWIQSYLQDHPDRRYLRGDVYYKGQHAAIEKILKHACALIATAPDAPDVILGYLVFSPGTVWYAYTKKAFRHHGVQRALLDRSGLSPDFSFPNFTMLGLRIIRNHDMVPIYNPYLEVAS